jgi:hypothetical protein
MLKKNFPWQFGWSQDIRVLKVSGILKFNFLKKQDIKERHSRNSESFLRLFFIVLFICKGVFKGFNCVIKGVTRLKYPVTAKENMLK